LSIDAALIEYTVGSLVRTRGREWVVLPASTGDMLVLRPLGGTDDDTTAVFPALERVEDAVFAPPTAADLGDASAAGLLRSALRIGFRSGAGPFRSLAGIAVEPRPYQLVPLLMALRQETVRLLIADDVGIGKTVEAGLIAAEMLAQGDANGLAVLCSPALAEQWQEELRTKFGIDAELVLASTVPRLERGLIHGESLFQRYPIVIVSLDFIKTPRHRDDFVKYAPDLVIVDEAHTCVADTGTGGKRQRQLRFELLRKLAADQSRHLLLVTATPHSGKEGAFRNLLGLIHPDLEHVALDSDAGRRELAKYFVQRRRADIRRYIDEDTPFPSDREFKELPYTLSPEYRKLLEKVLSYARESVRDADGALRQRVRWWSALALLRSLASSPAAAAQTLRTRAANTETDTPDDADELGRATIIDSADDEALEGIDAIIGADTVDDPSETAAERKRLLELAKLADGLRGEKDTKLAVLTKEVKKLLIDGYDPIVFCRFIPTAEYVAEHLTAALGSKKTTVAVAVVTGTLSPEQRLERIAALAAEGTRRVLVATDCLSEGVNLQEHFNAVLHYDLAWNPTRHEQREGRVDRFGQRTDIVKAVTLYGKDNRIDGIVLDVLLRKHKQIRKATGISVPVPDDSANVMQAVFESLLLRDTDLPPEQLALDLEFDDGQLDFDNVGVGGRVGGMHMEWQSAADREKASRSRFAQNAIKEEEVFTEVKEIRAALGGAGEVKAFTLEALNALRSQITPAADEHGSTLGFHATTATLPIGLTEELNSAVGERSSILFRHTPPPARGEAALVRTDPAVAAIARFVLDAALDGQLDGWQRPARRCGVIRTTAVTTRTTLLLVRYRFHLTLPSRSGDRQLVAEDAQLLAFSGSPANATWLDEAAAAALLDAKPEGNTAPDFAQTSIELVIGQLHDLIPALEAGGDRLAAGLVDSHKRVRTAVDVVRRGLKVTAQKPADILGVYVYLPAGGTQ
jgi:superfamily II DNA or RNA helicase